MKAPNETTLARRRELGAREEVDELIKAHALTRAIARRMKGLDTMPTSPEALAEAVLELLEDAGGRDALGRQARRAAAEAFSIEGFLAKYAVLYSRLHRGEDLSDLPFVIT